MDSSWAQPSTTPSVVSSARMASKSCTPQSQAGAHGLHRVCLMAELRRVTGDGMESGHTTKLSCDGCRMALTLDHGTDARQRLFSGWTKEQSAPLQGADTCSR